MTALEAIARTDALHTNAYSREEKLRWLAELDWAVKLTVLDRHCGEPAPEPDAGSEDRELLVDTPFESIYIHYLTAQICYHDALWEDYNAANARFREVWDRFAGHHTRTHMPRAVLRRFLF